MLKIDISIWPFGDRSKAKLIKTITIANIGGNYELGIYEVKLFKEGEDLKGNHEEWYPLYKENKGVEKVEKVMINRKQPIENFIETALRNLNKA